MKFTNLHPAWVVGFIDGEGTFSVNIVRDDSMKHNLRVQLRFVITQHVQDKDLIARIQEFFGCGSLIGDTDTKVQYRMTGMDNLENKLFPVLDEYPLQTKKSLDAAIFRVIFNKIRQGDHLTLEGLSTIQDLKSGINRGRMKISPLSSVINVCIMIQSKLCRDI